MGAGVLLAALLLLGWVGVGREERKRPRLC